MPIYKFTLGLRKSGFAASESYVSPVLTSGTGRDVLNTFLRLRLKLCASDVEVIGIRVASLTEKRRSNFYPPGKFNMFGDGLVTVPDRGTYSIVPGDVQEAGTDQARANINLRFTFDVDRTTTRYFAFVPDHVITGEPVSLLFDGNEGWYNKFLSFRDHLTTYGYQLRGRSRDAGFAEVPIRGWVQAAATPTNLGVVVANIDNTGFQQGTTVAVHNSRRKGTDKTSYNGNYYVQALNPSIVSGSIVIYLDGTQTGDPYSIKRYGVVQRVGYGYFVITKVEAIRAGVHKRGGSFGLPRGRRKVRVSLDP